MNRLKPRIAITMGDAAGVGPELCLRLLLNTELAETYAPIIFGDYTLLQRVAQVVGLSLSAPIMAFDDWATEHPSIQQPIVLDIPTLHADQVQPGQVQANCGEAAFRYIIAAIQAGLAGQVAAVTTAPINKEALHAAGHHFPGHTEIFAEQMQAERSCMMQYSEEITCSFVTTHVGYSQVPALLTTQRILDVIELTNHALQRIRGRAPKLLVCGLNPHAGENGLFGNREEERLILPAIDLARQQGIHITGPVPPDTAFIPARRREFDAVVCMYHDQGHIPVKMIAFESAVNTTLGLPVLRTSVDHGTAFDIAWRGEANPSSLFAAVRLAVQLNSQS